MATGMGYGNTTALTEVRMALAQARAAGVSFDPAWLSATRDLPRGQLSWGSALDATRATWTIAYTGAPPSPVCGALDLLAETRAGR